VSVIFVAIPEQTEVGLAVAVVGATELVFGAAVTELLEALIHPPTVCVTV
jgi:hypothetical protein